MSKDSYAPGELIGTIKFVFDKTKSRTLNATQAYDSNPSQIVLASYPATATKKAPTKSLEAEGVEIGDDGDVVGYTGRISVNETTYGSTLGDSAGTNKVLNPTIVVKPLTLSFSTIIPTGSAVGSKKANDPAIAYRTGSTAIFTSSAVNSGRLVGSSKRKSSANKDIFYGAITVGTVLYKEWQGKYAVLKVDLLTNNAILRVYNE
jgi:hypothetical protein